MLPLFAGVYGLTLNYCTIKGEHNTNTHFDVNVGSSITSSGGRYSCPPSFFFFFLVLGVAMSYNISYSLIIKSWADYNIHFQSPGQQFVLELIS